MQTAIRLKQKVTSETLTISIPEIEKLIGREVEIILLVDGHVDESAAPTKAFQNSRHIAGSFVLDEEAMQQMLSSRFR